VPTNATPAPPVTTPTTRGASGTGQPPTTSPAGVATGTATAGGLTVTVSVSPPHAAPGQAVQFVVSARDAVAHGVLGYQLSFGDGTSTHNVTPLLCTATTSPAAETWSLTHAYAASGTFTADATVSANCTPDRATASVGVTVP
jgi:hypothetical protein